MIATANDICFRTPTPENPLRVLALGAGVQSSWLLLASIYGELPPLDVAQLNRKMLVGLPYVHDSLIPLDMVDLDVDDGKRGAGCGIVFDQSGLQEGFAGMCGV